MPPLLRIFVSSPGDVIPERRRAHLVIEKIAKIYARFFTIEAVLWEVEPMLASGHFQDQIIPPSETDILLLIVWSRLGTPLPPHTQTREYLGIDGRKPVTGTEWEFEDALAAQKLRGAPDVLAYRKQADPTVSLRDRAAKASAEEQWDKLDQFWNRWFVNKGEFVAAFSEFIDLDSFEGKLEKDLRTLIDRRIHTQMGVAQDALAPTWLAGSPFRGLEVYRMEHAPIFFGRTAATKTAVEQLILAGENGRAFLLILGASGAGKSSLAQAGVLPALTARGVVPRGGHWRIAVVRPGGHPKGPFEALAEALTGKTALPELLVADQSVSALSRHLRAAAEDPSFPLVSALSSIETAMRKQGDLLEIERVYLAVVVDQLEELFTIHDTTADDRAAFVRCLNGLARSGQIFLVATMRSDYWHRAAETPLLVEMAAGLGRIDLLAPARDEIIEMIRQPANAAGLEFESDPVRNVRLDAVLAIEAETNPAAMPLLSFLLDEIYQRDVHDRNLSVLTYESMRLLGGLRGAIANRAETVFLALPSDVQATLPSVLRTLVTVGRSGAAATSRATSMTRFDENSSEYRLIQAFLDPHVRLLVVEGDGEGARVRLAHEALITNWDRAKRQIEQDRDDLRTRAVVEEALVEWRNASNRNKQSYLLRDPQLASALDLAKRWQQEFSEEALTFIQTSERRARMMHRLTIAAAAVFAVVAVVAVAATYLGHQARLLAESETIQAERQEAKALVTQSRFLVNQSEKLREAGYNATAIALALEALPDPKRGNDRPYLREAEQSLFGAVQAPHERAILRGHNWYIADVAFSPDGRSLLSSSGDHTIKVWDVAGWKERLRLDDKGGAVNDAKYSPDGRFILAAQYDGTARIFDADTGAVVHRLASTKDVLTYGSYSPDGTRILLASGNKLPRLWDAQTGNLIAVLSGNQDRVRFGAFAADSSFLVTVSADNIVHAWKALDGEALYSTETQQPAVNSVALSRDGRYLVTGNNDGALQIREARTGRLISSISGPPGFVGNISFSHDGSRVTAAYADNVARVWQISTGQPIFELKGHDAFITRIIFSKDGKLIATTSVDKTARLWDAESGRQIALFRGHKSPVTTAAFSPDGKWLATGSGDGINPFVSAPDNTVRIWSVNPELEVAAIAERNRILQLSELSPDGHFAVIQDVNNLDAKKFPVSARLWDSESRTELRDLRTDASASILSAAVSNDGARIATIEKTGTAIMWDANAASLLKSYEFKGQTAAAISFSRDGTSLATVWGPQSYGKGNFDIRIVKSSDGKLLKTLHGELSEINGVGFSSDNKWLFAYSNSYAATEGIWVWSLSEDSAPINIANGQTISQAVFEEGSDSILTQDGDGHVVSWAIKTGAQLADWQPSNENPARADVRTPEGISTSPVKSVAIAPNGLSVIIDEPSENAHFMRIIYRHTENRISVPADESGCGDNFVFASDSKRFLSFGSLLCLRDARNGKLLGKISGNFGHVTAVGFSGKGDIVAVGNDNGDAFFWNVTSAERPRQFKAHDGKITSLTFGGDQTIVTTVSSDGLARIWNVETGTEVGTMGHDERELASVLNVNSKRFLTLSNGDPVTKNGVATIVDTDSGAIISHLSLPSKGDPKPADISSIMFSKTGNRLFMDSPAADPTLYEMPGGKIITSVSAGDFHTQANLSPTGRLIAVVAASTADDGNSAVHLDLFDTAGNKVRSIPAPNSFGDVGFSPDDRFVIADSHLLSTETGEEWHIANDDDRPSYVFSSNGKFLANISKSTADKNPLLNAAAAWNSLTGKNIAILHGEVNDTLGAPADVTAIAVSSDGKTAAAGFQSGSIKIWDPATGIELGGLQHLKGAKADDIFGSSINGIAFTPEGKRLAVSDDKNIHIINLSDRNEIGSVASLPETNVIRFSADGRLMAASGRSSFQLWDLATLRELPAPKLAFDLYDNPAFAFSPDGHYIAESTPDDQAIVFSTDTGQTVATLRGHGSRVTKILFSPTGQIIATIARDDKIHFWDTVTFKETIVQTGYGEEINDIVFSPDGRTLAVASKKGVIGIWNVDRGSETRQLSGHTKAVKRLLFIAQGSTLISTSEDKTIRSWKVSTGEEIAHLSHSSDISDIVAAATTVITTDRNSPFLDEQLDLSVWDTSDRHKLKIQYDEPGKFDVLFSPNADYLVVMPKSLDQPTILWDVANERVVGKLISTEGIGRSAIFSPDGKLVVTFGFKDQAQIWRTADATLLGTIVGSRVKDIAEIMRDRSMSRVDFLFGGQRILTYSTNGLLRLWDTASFELLNTLDVENANYAVAMDGKRLIFNKTDGTVHIWRMPENTQELVNLACEHFPGPLTVLDRQEFALDPSPEHYPCNLKP